MDLDTLLAKYAGHVLPDPNQIRRDMALLVDHAKRVVAVNAELREEMRGATQTLTALAYESGGHIDVKFSTVEFLDTSQPTLLSVEDLTVDGPDGEQIAVKRFTCVLTEVKKSNLLVM